jgi:hypothetical protein
MKLSRTRVVVSLSALALAVGCIDTSTVGPDDAPPMCEIDSDCDDASGEICDDGVCWGDPPADTAFAAIIVPPDGRDDLVASEIPELVIDLDGTVDGLVFADFVRLSGRVTLAADSTTSIAAQIRVRRASRIPGGPTYSRTVIAQANVAYSELAFDLELPRLSAGDSPYEVTIIPDDGTLAEAGVLGIPSDLAPPVRFLFDGTESLTNAEWALGDQSQMKLVAGRVVDAAERGLAGMKVVARGRWTIDGPIERASSSASTGEDGEFAIWIPMSMEDQTYELVVRPPVGTVAPTLRKSNVFIPDPKDVVVPVEIDELVMPSFPAGARYEIPIRGAAPEGGYSAVEGAEVRVTTFLLDPAAQGETGLIAFYSASGVTDAMGNVQLDLIPGGTTNRAYLVSVLPLPTSSQSAAFERPVLVGPPSAGVSVLQQLVLEFRVPVHGVLMNDGGLPVSGAAVSARATTAYKWSFSPELQDELNDFRFPTATTDEGGGFVIWLDNSLLGVNAQYDLEFVPSASAQAPRWSIHGIDVTSRGTEGGVELGAVALPPASFARGDVMSSMGELIAGATVNLYEISTDTTACDSANHPDDNGMCYPPALLRHVAQSDENGRVVLVLPDP